jgi:DNA-directed RNA polymerase specialized sigma24 family protein
LDEALEKLAKKDQMKTDLVKLRYFAGLTCGQAAKMLGISQSTADEHWAYAKAWLKAEIVAQDKSNTT